MLHSLLILSASAVFTLAISQPAVTPPNLFNHLRLRFHDTAPLGADGTVIDTPEVVAAKKQHFATYNDVVQTLSRLQRPVRFHNKRKTLSNVHKDVSNTFYVIAPERFKVAHNIKPEVNNSSTDINFVRPERFNVAHNVKPEEGSIIVNKSLIEEDAIDKFVSGLNLLNIGRLNSESQQNKLKSSAVNSHIQKINTLTAKSNKSNSVHVEKPVEKLIQVGSEEVNSKNEHSEERKETIRKPEVIVTHDGFVVDPLDVSEAKSEHLAAHAEQVTIQKDLHEAATKSDEARNKDEYIEELDRKIGVLKNDLKFKEEVVRKSELIVPGVEYLNDSSDVAKALSEHLAAQAEQVAIQNAAIKSNEAVASKSNVDVAAKVEVSPQGYIQDSEDVARAKIQHLALHAELVALHNAAVKAADAVDNQLPSSSSTLNGQSNISVSSKGFELNGQDNVKESPSADNLESVGSVLNLIPENVGILISFDTQQNLSSNGHIRDNKTQDLVYPNVNIEINLNEKYIKVYPGVAYTEPIRSVTENVNNSGSSQPEADGNCTQKEKKDDSIVYIARPVSVSEYVQGGLLSDQGKNYLEIADFLHHHKHGSLESEKNRDSLKYFTP